jgi:hypothetical protein
MRELPCFWLCIRRGGCWPYRFYFRSKQIGESIQPRLLGGRNALRRGRLIDMRKFFVTHLPGLLLSGFLLSFFVVRVAEGRAQPRAMYFLAILLSAVAMFSTGGPVLKVLTGRTISRRTLRLPSDSFVSFDFSVPTRVRKGRLLLFFEQDRGPSQCEILVLNRVGSREKTHLATREIKTRAFALHVPRWLPVRDRGTTYWLASWHATSGLRLVAIDLPQPLEGETVLEIQIAPGAPSEAGMLRTGTGGCRVLSLVLKERSWLGAL